MAVLITSCTTTIRNDGSKGLMQGMLYDFDNSPICGYELELDGKIRVFTDINGRFEFPSAEYKTHTLTGNGNGYIEIDRAYDFSDRSQILYLKIPSIDNLYTQLDTALSTSQNEEAEKLLQTLSKYRQTEPKFKLYEAIYRFRNSTDTDKSLLTTEIKQLENELSVMTKKKTGAE